MPKVELELEGMTCASCANRIERKLNKVDGVTATVNFATERAAVEFPPTLDVDDMIKVVQSTGYDAHQRHPMHDHAGEMAHADSLDGPPWRLIVAVVLAIPVTAISMIHGLQFSGWGWVVLALTTPIVFWSGWPFHRATIVNLRHGASTMDTLVSVGTIAAYIWSVVSLFTGGHLYFETAAVVTAFLLLGRYLEDRSGQEAGAALRSLLSLGAKDVAVVRDEVEQRIPIGQLVVGDLFVARPGERIATDGVVVEGESAVDTSLLTGEPVPVEVSPGADVTGATVNDSGRLLVRATRVGADTQLAQMGRLVEEAQTGKSDVQRLADRISGIFVPIVFVIAAVTLAAWWLITGDVEAAFTAAVAVLIIACPCALGLATPTALLVGTGRGAQLGILIRGPQVLEQTRKVSTMLLDKTGTLTEGKMSLASVTGEGLREAAAVESASEHPVGKAITAAVADHPSVTEFVNEPGQGVRGLVDGRMVRVGKPAFVGTMTAELTTAFEQAPAGTVVAVGWDGGVHGIITVTDRVKPTAAAAIAELRGLGIKPVLLTGDNERTARAVAAEVGIDEVIAEVLPQDKVDVVRRFQQQSGVAMVGDGVNDAAALAQADLGIAMGTGSDVAIEASDLTVVRDDLGAVPDAIRLSRRTLAIIRGNLFWAFGYNVAAIPLAALGLLTPMIAGAAMAFSSVFVVANSLRLRRFKA